MKVATFSEADSEIVKNLPSTQPIVGKNIDAALVRFMKREYPGYLDK